MIIELLILPAIGWIVYRQEGLVRDLTDLKVGFALIERQLGKKK